jgi:hypothetical protein
MKLYFPILFLITLSSISCQSQNNENAKWVNITPEQLDNSILMIDYPDAKNYDDALSNKTELSIFNINKRQNTRLTNDTFSDSKPTLYPNKKAVFFESKRPAKDMFAENGTPHIYKLNLANGEIINYDSSLVKQFPNILGDECADPAWSSDYKLAFSTRKKVGSDLVDYLCIYSEKQSIINIIDSTKSSFLEVHWAPDNNKLYYEILNLKREKQIVYDLSKKTRRSIEYDKNIILWFKGWEPNSNELIFQNVNDDGFIELKSYNLKDNSIEDFYTNKNILGKFLCFGKAKNELFINELNRNANKYNLLKIDLSTNKITRLNHKDIYIDDNVEFIK